MRPSWIERTTLQELSRKAAANRRLRLNLNLHEMEDQVHRLFNALEPGTYIRPHRHFEPPRTETVLLVAGRLAVILFDASGAETQRRILTPSGETIGIHVAPETWHTLVALERGTVFFETKEGPYVPPAGNDIASWAPEEGSPGARDLEESWRESFGFPSEPQLGLT